MSSKCHALILFEPNTVESLGPPVDHRPVWELRVGALSLRERLERAGLTVAGGWARPCLRSLVPALDTDCLDEAAYLLVAGDQLLQDPEQRAALSALAPGERLEADGRIAALCLPGNEVVDWLQALDHEASVIETDEQILAGPLGPHLRFWWELFESAGDALAADLPLILGAGEWRSPQRSEWSDCARIHLAEGVEVAPGVVIDASGGPVVLDRDVRVGAGSYIQGPCHLGRGTRVKPQSQLLHGCFAGPQCRLGGEIEETQFQGFANKQHHGFLGHAVVGEWVNLGAGVCNSDLKNNYSAVRVRQRGRELESHRTFLGCCLGDHVKVAIQGRINTGSVLEAFTCWFGAGFPPKGLPAFTWGGDDSRSTHALEKALDTAGIVMERRGRKLSESLTACYRVHFEATAEDRRRIFDVT